VGDSAIRQAVNLSESSTCLDTLSIETTENYLGCKQRFHNAVNAIGLDPASPQVRIATRSPTYQLRSGALSEFAPKIRQYK
jgi:hypothetical protein